MEGAIGGSALDDLWNVMGLDGLDDGDIVFTIVDDSSVDLGPDYTDDDCYIIHPGQTYVAKCMIKDCPLYKATIGEDEYIVWVPYEQKQAT